MGEAFIDLGEVGEDHDAPEPPRNGPKWRLSAPIVAPLLVLCVLALVAAPAPRPQVVRIADFPGIERGFTLVEGGLLRQDGDQIFLIGPDGRERWRIHWPARGDDFPQASAAHGLVLLRTSTVGDEARTVALDFATGQWRWEQRGWLHRVGDFLLQWEESALRVFEPGEGRMLWESIEPRAVGLDQANGSVFVLDRERRLVEHDMRAGGVRRSGELPLPAGFDFAHINVAADHLTVVVSSMDEQHVEEQIFLDRQTLQRIDVSAVGWDLRMNCGAADCVMDFRKGVGGGVADRASGRLLWSVSEGQSVLPWPDGSVIILGYTNWPGETRVIELVEPLTRRRLVEVAGWTMPLDTERFEWLPIPAAPIALFRAKGRPTLVARIGAAGIRVLGSVPSEANNCRYIAPLLQCRTARSTIGVWRIGD